MAVETKVLTAKFAKKFRKERKEAETEIRTVPLRRNKGRGFARLAGLGRCSWQRFHQ